MICFLSISLSIHSSHPRKDLGAFFVIFKNLSLKLRITHRFLLHIILEKTMVGQGLAPPRPPCPRFAGGQPGIQTPRPLCSANRPGSEPGPTDLCVATACDDPFVIPEISMTTSGSGVKGLQPVACGPHLHFRKTAANPDPLPPCESHVVLAQIPLRGRTSLALSIRHFHLENVYLLSGHKCFTVAAVLPGSSHLQR